MPQVSHRCFSARESKLKVKDWSSPTSRPISLPLCNHITGYHPSLHTALTHQEEWVTYVRILFVDSNSAFNTAHPQTAPVGSQLTSICNWILSFLSKHHHGLAPVSLQSMMNQSTEWRCKMWWDGAQWTTTPWTQRVGHQGLEGVCTNLLDDSHLCSVHRHYQTTHSQVL